MAGNVDNFPNISETLSASKKQFHSRLFDDQNLTYEHFRPSIVSTPINSDHEVSIFEQIDNSSEESFEERVAHGLWHIQTFEFEIRRQKLAPLIDRLVQVSLGKCITCMQLCFITIMHSCYIMYHSIYIKFYFHLHKSTEEHSKAYILKLLSYC